ncbi:MAG TPA: hypothetical protein VJ885_10910, partial [Thermoanaerobaculia bacterium]|nr:hypothetical protein [Thermoanaerobaculia bacterium]
MRQRVPFPQDGPAASARPGSHRFQDRPFASPRSPASPPRTLPAFPVRPVQPAPAVTIQRSFKKAVLEDKSRDDLWIDEDTDQIYRFLLQTDKSILLIRLRDGFRVWIDLETLEPGDLDETYKEARLATEKTWTEVLYGDKDSAKKEDLSEDAEMSQAMKFEQVKAPVDLPPFLQPRKVGVKKEKKPSAFTARVLVQPVEDPDRMEISNGYSAGQLEILEVRVSNERPPTRFEPFQESHTTAWTLIRAALASFTGRSLADLLDFLSHGLDDLTSDAETEQAARTIAATALPEAGYLASLRNENLPIQLWIDLVSQIMWAYEVAYHKSAAAAYKNGDPGNRGEHDAMSHLREVEAELWKDNPDDIDELYKKYKFKGDKRASKLTARVKRRKRIFKTLDPSALSDIVDLIDVTFNASLPPRQYARAVRHWFELLWLAFPKVMAKVGDRVAAYFLDQELPDSAARWLLEELQAKQEQENQKQEEENSEIQEDSGLQEDDPDERDIEVDNDIEVDEDIEVESSDDEEHEPAKTGRDLIGALEQPGYGLPKKMPKMENVLKGADETSLNAQVRLNPVGEPRGSGHSEQYLLDELAIRFIRVGEERPPTRFSSQRSHTVAWTLMRASVLGFSGQPLANLYAFVRHGLEELRDDLGETWQGDADKALETLRTASSA